MTEIPIEKIDRKNGNLPLDPAFQRVIFISNTLRIPWIMKQYGMPIVFLATNLNLCRNACLDIAPKFKCTCHSSSNRFFIHERITSVIDSNTSLLFHHFDMYVNASILNRSSVNIPKIPRCLKVEALRDDKNWTWPMGAKTKCMSLMRRYGFKKCCQGWIDAFYIPAVHVPKVRKQFKAANGLMNEAAVPTILQQFAHHNLNCLGGCCKTVAFSDVFQRGCGHRIDLRKEPHR